MLVNILCVFLGAVLGLLLGCCTSLSEKIHLQEEIEELQIANEDLFQELEELKYSKSQNDFQLFEFKFDNPKDKVTDEK